MTAQLGRDRRLAPVKTDSGRRRFGLPVISKMLGHADFGTTVDVYSHLSRERSRVAAARIDRAPQNRTTHDEVAI